MAITIQGKTFERLEGYTGWKEWVATADSECPPDAVGKMTQVIINNDVTRGFVFDEAQTQLEQLGEDWFWRTSNGDKDNEVIAYCTAIHELSEVENPKHSSNKSSPDFVNKPPHYQLIPGTEVIDVLDALCKKIDNSDISLSSNQVSYYTQALGYLMRFMDKNGKQDVEKAVWYLKRMLDKWEG